MKTEFEQITQTTENELISSLKELLSLHQQETCDKKSGQKTIDIFQSLQDLYSDLCTLTVLIRKTSAETIALLQDTHSLLEKLRSEIILNFSNATIDNKRELELVKFEPEIKFSLSRLIYALSELEASNFTQILLLETEKNKVIINPLTISLLREALAFIPESIASSLTAIAITQDENGQYTCDLYFSNDSAKVSKWLIVLNTSNEFEDLRANKKIVMAIEGDIAGHAVRSLETAKALRRLGYAPKFIGNGYYTDKFRTEGFEQLPPFSDHEHSERERIISRARGDERSLFFWDPSTVREKTKKYEQALKPEVESGIDLLITDMNPIAEIAISHLQKSVGMQFPIISQTHDIRLSPDRLLKTVKVLGLPIGKLLYGIHESRLRRVVDPKDYSSKIIYHLYNDLADYIMGLPLLINDVEKSWKAIFSAKQRKKFTDYIYGPDATILFSLTGEKFDQNTYPVGLQAEQQFYSQAEIDFWQNTLAPQIPLIFHFQGSTYHKKVWAMIRQAVLEIADSYSIHATGIREDLTKAIAKKGYDVGYVDGYFFSKLASVMINHGGFGTISQWLLASATRISQEKLHFETLIEKQANLEIINSFLNSCLGVSRSISICNTFEQENNSRILKAAGGNNVCQIATVNDLLAINDTTEQVQDLVLHAINAPLSKEEIQFWLNITKSIATMAAPAQTALTSERIMLNFVSS